MSLALHFLYTHTAFSEPSPGHSQVQNGIATSWVGEETQHQNSGHVSSLMPLVQQQSTFWTEIKTLSNNKGAQCLQVLEESSPHFPLPIWENPQISGGFGSSGIPLSSAALESSSPTSPNSVFISDLCKYLFFTHWRCYSFMEIVF